jgi:hypothetical protein
MIIISRRDGSPFLFEGIDARDGVFAASLKLRVATYLVGRMDCATKMIERRPKTVENS